MVRRADALVVVSILIGIIAASLATAGVPVNQPQIPLALGAIVAIGGIIHGSLRSRARLGYVDLFDPAVFPLGYVAVSFLAPAWSYFIDHQPLLGFTTAQMSPQTPWLMCLATVALTLGVTYRRSERPASAGKLAELRGRPLLHLGRVFLLVPLVVGGYNVARGGAAVRGIDQVAVTALDTLNVAAQLLMPLAALLMLAGHRALGRIGLLATSDWIMLTAAITLIGATGSRSPAIATALALLYVNTRRRGAWKATALGLLAVLLFVVVVASYRASQSGTERNLNGVHSALTDLSVATYTTGITAKVVPDPWAPEYGATYAGAIARQLPSAISARLGFVSGPSGTSSFRDMINAKNPNQGWGYSLPAEGYLNFGALGLASACLLYGLTLSWAYIARAWLPTRTRALFYPILMTAMPIAIRSDAIGLIKSVLYPLIITAFVFALARSTQTMGKPKYLKSSHQPERV